MRRTGAGRWIAVLMLGLTVALGGCEEEEEDVDVDTPVAPIAPQVQPTPVVTPTPVAPQPAVPAVVPEAVGDAPTAQPATPTGTAANTGNTANTGTNTGNTGNTGTNTGNSDNTDEDRATQQEAALIEAQRALGQSGNAQRLMRDFVNQHPNSPQARVYRQLLQGGGGNTPGTPGTPNLQNLPNPGLLLPQ